MIAVSSICSGISPERAIGFACELQERLGFGVGLELVSTRSTPPQSFLADALDCEVSITSLHGPSLFPPRETPAQRVEATFWRQIQGGVSFGPDGTSKLNNPAFEMGETWGLPVVIHGLAALRLILRGQGTANQTLGKAIIRIENDKEILSPVASKEYMPFRLAVQTAAILTSIGFNVGGICLDIGHLAEDAVKHRGWQGDPHAFVRKFVLPAEELAAEAGFDIVELHLHDFDARRCRDHLPPGKGCLPFGPILEHFLSRDPIPQLTLEVVPDVLHYLALSSRLRWGYEKVLDQVEGSIRYLQSIAPQDAFV